MKKLEFGSNNKKIKSPITEHVLAIKHFSIFSSFLNQIEQFLFHWLNIAQIEWFLFHWMNKLKCYKLFLNITNKGTTQEMGRRWMIVCFKKIE
jgi:hypothetical protein